MTIHDVLENCQKCKVESKLQMASRPASFLFRIWPEECDQ